MEINLPYGDKQVRVNIPDHAHVVIPKELPGLTDLRAEIRRALDAPIGTPSLTQLAAGKSDAVIVINDITRPAPSGIMLEELLRNLALAGITEDRVTAFIATGNHRPNTDEEIKGMIGPGLASRLRVVNHDCDDPANLTHLGHTDSGLPVWINSRVAAAAFKIATGLITPHHGAGYSGGRKSVMPGVAGLKTLNRHHSLPIRPYHPAYGWMKGNAFHEEAVKAARMFFKPAASAQAAIDDALAVKGPDARVLVLPQAVSCVPCVRAEQQNPI